MPNTHLPFDEQMALPGVRHSLRLREEESAHVTPEGGLWPSANDDDDDNDDEAMVAICSSSSSALVEGFMVYLVAFSS